MRIIQRWVVQQLTERWSDMNSIQENIYRPLGLDRVEDLNLPPVVRHFEAEPLRKSKTIQEFRDPTSGRLHNDGRYAVVLKDGSREWWKHGHAHTVADEPAITVGRFSEVILPVPVGFEDQWREELCLKNGSKVWCEDGVIHRDGDKPAIESGNYREYWHQGRRHRDGGPAVFGLDERWYYHGLVHRADGPATLDVRDRSKNRGLWIWYGVAFSASEDDDNSDFPFHEPPPVFYLTAFANMQHEPLLPDEAVDTVVAKVAELMPDFPKLWSLRDVCGWDEIRQCFESFSEAHKKGCTANLRGMVDAADEVLPLPVGVGAEEHAIDVAKNGKVA